MFEHVCCYFMLVVSVEENINGRKEGNYLFNDALNTFCSNLSVVISCL